MLMRHLVLGLLVTLLALPADKAAARQLAGSQTGGQAQHGHETGGDDKSAQGHGAHHHGEQLSLPGGPGAPSLAVEITADSLGGWNVHIRTSNFRFAPQNVNGPHKDGEGHAHIYVNGEKIARVYGPWFHIGALPRGMNAVTVTLNANDHRALAVGDAPLAVTQDVHVH